MATLSSPPYPVIQRGPPLLFLPHPILHQRQDIESKTGDPDHEPIKPISASLSTWLPGITVHVRQKDLQEERDNMVNAELRKALKPPAQAATNADVEEALSRMNGTTMRTILDVARKETVREVAKSLQPIKKDLQKIFGREQNSDPSVHQGWSQQKSHLNNSFEV